MKQLIKKIITKKTFRPLLDITDSSVASILTLHRVDQINPAKLRFNEHLKISPDFLENLIKQFRKNGFSFVSIDELYDVLTKQKRANKLLIFTMDDGYLDNYENALPIFKQHSIPFTIYISTSLPEKQMIYWWYILEDLILENDKIVLNTNETFICNSKAQKESIFLEIREKIIGLNPFQYKKTLPELFSNYSFDVEKYNDCLPLSWHQIELLGNEPLVKIGAHTHSHIALKFCTKEEIIGDISYSNDLFQKHLGQTPKHFCFPYGDSNSLSEKDFDLIKEMDFKTAVTTNSGNIYNKHNQMLHKLPRIFVSENQESNLIDDINLMKFKRK